MLYSETSRTSRFRVMSSLVIVLLCIHGVCALLSMSNYLYSQSLQYKRLCECAVFSTVLILTLLVILIVDVQKEKYSNIVHSDINARLITYLIIFSFLSSQMFHIMGMPPSTTGLLITWSSVSWIIVLINLKYDFTYIIFIIAVLCSSLFVNVSLENDSRVSHEEKYNNKLGEIHKSSTSDSHNVTGIVPCLYLLNETIKDNYTALTNKGVIADNIDGASWCWDRTLALLQNSQLLSNAISSTLVQMFKTPATPNDLYPLNQLVSRLFGMFESIYEHNLALFIDYTNVVASQKFISGRKDVLELVIFLILQNILTYGYNEVVKHYPIVMIQCNQVNNLYYIGFNVVSLDNRKHVMFHDEFHKESSFEMSPLLQLANRITSAYLGCTIDCMEPTYNAGVKEIIINIRVDSPDISITTKGVGLGMQVESLINPTWLFVEDQKLVSFDTLKAKFNLLRVPITQCLAHNLIKITEKYCVALISEDLLMKHLEQFKLQLRDIAVHIVVVCKNPKSPSDIFSDYKLKVSACLNVDSMIIDVYNCIMYLCAKQHPRVIVGNDDFSTFFNNHLSELTSISDISSKNNASSFSRHNITRVNKSIKIMKSLENRLLCDELHVICNHFFTQIQVHLPSSSQQLVLINHIIDECKERIKRTSIDVSAYDENRNKYLFSIVEKELDDSVTSNKAVSVTTGGEVVEITNKSDSIYFLLPNERTKVAFFIYNTFVPVIISIKEKFNEIQFKGKQGDIEEYASIRSTLLVYSTRATTYKLHLLGTMLLTLYDLVGVIHSFLININDESKSSQLLVLNRLLIHECRVTELYLVTYFEYSI